MSETTERDLAPGLEVGWQFIHLTQAAIASLEIRATTMIVVETGGLIAIWTALHDFEHGTPRALAWTAWAVLLAAVTALAPLLTTHRLSSFWETVTRGFGPAGMVIDRAEEAERLGALSVAMRSQMRRLAKGVEWSVALSVLALMLVAVGYVIEKT